MACIGKEQNESLLVTKSTYTCDHCFHRVVITRQGVRKEDHSIERKIDNGVDLDAASEGFPR
jgi:hypothetical protein